MLFNKYFLHKKTIISFSTVVMDATSVLTSELHKKGVKNIDIFQMLKQLNLRFIERNLKRYKETNQVQGGG
jgi:hypothetical protein